MFNREKIIQTLAEHPFKPSWILKNRHTQTVLGVFFPYFPYFKSDGWSSSRRFLELADGDQIAVDYTLQQNPAQHFTVVIVPGLIASSDATYALGIGHKAFHYGFNVVRMNLRNQGETEHLSKSLYHGGQSADVITLLNSLVGEGLDKIYLAGVSLAGNICLKAVGELGPTASGFLKGVGVLSPVVDPLVSWQPMERRENFFYQINVLRGLKGLIKRKAKIDPEEWDVSLLKHVKTMRQWDTTFQVPFYGFKTCDDYYRNESCMPWIPKIVIPSLAIHAKDDTIVPVEPLERSEILNNQNIITLLTERGGHTGFIAGRRRYGDLDLHWDQNRLVEFFRLLSS